MTLTTYLNYGGNCEEAFRYYEKHLGGKIIAMLKDGSGAGASQERGGGGNAVMHARIQIGHTMLMASDVPGENFQPIRGVYLALGVSSKEEAERVHAALAEGGQVFTPLQETFFAHRFSMLRDRFGACWMVVQEKPLPQA